MPWLNDSRGDAKLTGFPSTNNSPSLCGCNPAMILISVDFPAPLSPNTQLTSPAFTVKLIPFNARIAPVGLAHVHHLDQRVTTVQLRIGMLMQRVRHDYPTFLVVDRRFT